MNPADCLFCQLVRIGHKIGNFQDGPGLTVKRDSGIHRRRMCASLVPIRLEAYGKDRGIRPLHRRTGFICKYLPVVPGAVFHGSLGKFLIGIQGIIVDSLCLLVPLLYGSIQGIIAICQPPACGPVIPDGKFLQFNLRTLAAGNRRPVVGGPVAVDVGNRHRQVGIFCGRCINRMLRRRLFRSLRWLLGCLRRLLCRRLRGLFSAGNQGKNHCACQQQ